MVKTELLYLSFEDVKNLIDLRWTIDTYEASMHRKRGRASAMYFELDQTERKGVKNYIYTSSSLLSNLNICKVDWIVSFPGNPVEKDLPRAQSFNALHNASNGLPLAIIDYRNQNIISTVATGALGAKYLAKKDSEVIGIIGTGAMGRGALRALDIVLPKIKEVRAYDMVYQKAEQYAKDMKSEFVKLDVKAVDNPSDAVLGADVVVTCTTADEPIVKNDWCSEGVLLIHIGTGQEEECDVITNSDKIVFDIIEVVKSKRKHIRWMYSEGLLKDEDIYAELDEIVTKKKPGRTSSTEKIFYMFNAAGGHGGGLDLSYKLYESAMKKGIGQKLSFTPELNYR